jgi:DNA polymerase III delta prime subunit
MAAGPKPTQDSSPKVALLGQSGVGKTTLAERLSRDEFISEPSTQSVSVRPLFEKTQAGTLLLEAGLPGSVDYEPVGLTNHEFSVAVVLVSRQRDDGDIAEVAELARWLSSKKNRLPFRKILAESRVDIALQTEAESMDSLARRFGFDSGYQTSAKTGEGIQELRAAILSAVEWQREQEPAIEAEVEFIVRTLAEGLCEIIAKEPNALDHIEWRDLERIIASALRELGFWVELTPPAKDGGKDIIARCTIAKAQKVYYVEVKHWKKDKPGSGQITNFIEVNSLNHTDGGLFLSSSGYTEWAHSRIGEIMRHRVRLGERDKIVALCQQYVRTKRGMWMADKPLPELLFEQTLSEDHQYPCGTRSQSC